MTDLQESHSPSGQRGGIRGNASYALVALGVTSVVVAMSQTLVIPLLPSLAALFDTSAEGASWVLTSTLLSTAISTPIVGRLADMFGKRRMLRLCVGSLVLASALCAVGSTLEVVLVGRTLQGVGVAAVPLTISIARDVIPPARLGTAVAFLSSSLGVGSAVGLPVSAFVAGQFGWNALFWVATAIAGLCWILVSVVIAETPAHRRGRVDIVGSLGLAVWLGSLLVALSNGARWGWGSTRIAALGVIAALTLFAWVRRELAVDSPIVDLRAGARPAVLMTHLTGITSGYAMYTVNLLAPQMLQLPRENGFGAAQSVLAAGLWMVPSGLMIVVMSQVAARIVARRGARTSLLSGLAIITFTNLGVQATLELRSPAVISCYAAIVSAGIALTFSSFPTLIMSNTPRRDTAAANGLNVLARSVGTSAASASIGAVFGAMTTITPSGPVVSLAGMRVAVAMCTLVGVVSGVLAFAIPDEGAS